MMRRRHCFWHDDRMAHHTKVILNYIYFIASFCATLCGASHQIFISTVANAFCDICLIDFALIFISLMLPPAGMRR